MATVDVEDYYQVLRVPPTVDLAGIQNAYSRLAREFADRIGYDDVSRDEMKQLNEAYAVLADPEMRRSYDRQFFADEFAAMERRRKLQALRLRANRWTILGALAGIVAIEMIVVSVMGYSNANAVVDWFGDGWTQIAEGAGFAWGKVESAHDAVGSPLEVFTEMTDTLGRLT